MPVPDILLWTSSILGSFSSTITCLGCMMGSCLFCQHVPRLKMLLERVARGEALPAERMSLRHDIVHDRVAAGLAQAAVTGLRHTGHHDAAERIGAEMRTATANIRPPSEMGRVGSAPAFASDTAAGRILAGRQTPANSSQGTPPRTQTIPLRVSHSHPTAGTERQSSTQPRPEVSSPSSTRAAIQPRSTTSGPQSRGSLSLPTSTPSTTSNSPRRSNRPTQNNPRGEGMTAKATSRSVGASPVRGMTGERSADPSSMSSPFAGSESSSSSENSLGQGTGKAGPSIRKAE